MFWILLNNPLTNPDSFARKAYHTLAMYGPTKYPIAAAAAPINADSPHTKRLRFHPVNPKLLANQSRQRDRGRFCVLRS